MKSLKFERVRSAKRATSHALITASRRRAARMVDLTNWTVLTDIDAERQRLALTSTAQFVTEQMGKANSIRAETRDEVKESLIELAMQAAPPDGLVLEFGVATGWTLERIAKHRFAHGFDSFEGLPENWRTGFERGRFAQDVPHIANAELHIGWFQDTLPDFLDRNPGSLAVLHVDSDLYSSAATIFVECEARFQVGTIILFDEYFNFPGWEGDEHRAFMEFIGRTGHGFRYLAYAGQHEQVLVQITS